MPGEAARFVVLGASNLARGFPALISVARGAWGPGIQVLAALGHGRSYGAPSRVGIRTLPGILECGLWRNLQSLPDLPTRALISDVGNDILYGYAAEQILAWIEDTIDRLQRTTHSITMTNLPVANIHRLTRASFLIFRSILFPSSRLSFSRAIEAAERVNQGLAELSAARGIRLFHLDPTWYGLDPIHIRRSLLVSAWQKILNVTPAENGRDSSLLERLNLRISAPERRWLLGVEQFTPQSGLKLSRGGRVWLY